MGVVRTVVWVDGLVQGVGFRWWVAGEAARLGVVGSAENLADGRVRVDAQGPSEAVDALVDALIAPGGARGGGRRRPGHVSGHLVESRRPDDRLTDFTTG
ncbi:acylphosphatase [Propioniciclava soli]|uniref:acylphosphatase n=1 Tax=Propioniciclava soli TaxID=2775081 RepID=A0ABZ3CBW0_9ACTN